MNHFEYGFFDELEKAASAEKSVYSGAKGALLGGLLGAGGLAGFSALGHHGVDSHLVDQIDTLKHNMEQQLNEQIASSTLPRELAEKLYKNSVTETARDAMRAAIEQALKNRAAEEHAQIAGMVDKATLPVIGGTAGTTGLLAGLRRAAKEKEAAQQDEKNSGIAGLLRRIAAKKD